jgi:magnesium chelatase accessory protein
MAQRLDWHTDGKDWPHRGHSRFVEAGGLRWHVQEWAPPRPEAPRLLLIHGTGASTHSWRHVAPLLARECGVLAFDLPGHAFTEMARGSATGMRGMARGVSALMAAVGASPDAIVGHSAGAAIAIRMALDSGPDAIAPGIIVGLNAALVPFEGLIGNLFAPAARLLAANPLVPQFVSWQAADDRVFKRLLRSTGSHLDAEGEALYRRLVASPGHVAGVLAMMAHWDLPALRVELPRLRTPMHLVVAELDGTVPPADAAKVQRWLANASVHEMKGVGHLGHEERPAEAAELILRLVMDPSTGRPRA